MAKWQVPIMENWNQDHPERYSNFYGLYIKFLGAEVAVELARSMEKSGSSVVSPGNGMWQKACIYICKHILKFSNCVLVSVPINNNNYE